MSKGEVQEGATQGTADTGVAAGDKWIGAVIDKYSIVRLLGRGGMGAVYEARHAKVSRRFAIKFLLPRHADNADVLRRFENEAKAAGRLEHPNLAAVTDFGRADDGSPYIVMEFLQGKDCAALLRQCGPLPVYRAANIVAQACRGLAVAHQTGIVHRDLKPENLFVTDAGDGTDLLKVLDFGIAKLRTVDAGTATGTGEMFGTAHYMSPEQARGTGEVDQRTDVWSLGVVLYELLAGRKPFEGQQFLDLVYQIQTFEPPSLAAVAPRVPARMVQIVQQAMTKNLARRFPSVLALADALGPFASPFATGKNSSGSHQRPDPAAETAATPATYPPRSAPDTARAGKGGGAEEGAAAPVASGLGSLRVARGWWRTNKVLAAALLMALLGGAAFLARRFSMLPGATTSAAGTALLNSPQVAPPGPALPVAPPRAPPPTPATPVAAVPPAPALPRSPEPSLPSANSVRTLSPAKPTHAISRAVRASPRTPVADRPPVGPAESPRQPTPPPPAGDKPASGRPLYIDTGDPLTP